MCREISQQLFTVRLKWLILVNQKTSELYFMWEKTSYFAYRMNENLTIWIYKNTLTMFNTNTSEIESGIHRG